MKKFFALCVLLLAAPLFGQVTYSTVTATVTDPSGNPYANATLFANLVNSAGYPVSSASTPNGQLFNAKQVQATLDATGHFSIQLVPNNILSKPSGTQWSISISYPANSAILTVEQQWPITYSFSVAGPIDLSSSLSSLAQPVNFVNLLTGQTTLISGKGCLGGNAIANGCTGATTAAGALANLGGISSVLTTNQSMSGQLTDAFGFVGPLTGVASGNLPSAGGALSGPISFSNNSAANSTMTNLGITQTGTPMTSSQVDNFPGSVNVVGTVAANDTIVAGVVGFPQQLLGFQGQTQPIFSHDTSTWDASGIGAPSNTIFINGEYWLCYAGYPDAGFHSQTIGCAHATQLNYMLPYAGNPVIVNTHPSWANACIEGPVMYVESGTVYMFFNGYPTACDAEGTGSIGMVSTSVANFPTGWTPMAASPAISKPDGMNWLYRPWVLKNGNTYYNFSNGGDTSNTNIIGYFTSPSINGPWSYQGTVLTASQAWEAGGEMQDPQVWHDPSGLWIMGFGANGTGTNMGFAISSDLAHWSQLATNPIPVATTPIMYLPKWTRDAEGQYWMFSAPNNSPGMYISKAVGPSLQSPLSVYSIFGAPTGIMAQFAGLDNAAGYHQVFISANHTRSAIGTNTADGFAVYTNNGVDQIYLAPNASATSPAAFVGIATDAPLAQLHVQSLSSGPDMLLWSRLAGSTNTSGLLLSAADNTVNTLNWAKGGLLFSGDGSGLGFGTLCLANNIVPDSSNATAASCVLTIKSSGTTYFGASQLANIDLSGNFATAGFVSAGNYLSTPGPVYANTVYAQGMTTAGIVTNTAAGLLGTKATTGSGSVVLSTGTGATKTCTTYPTVVGGIVTGC